MIRLVYPTPTWEDLVELALDEIRAFGAGQYQVARRLRALLDALRADLPEHRRPWRPRALCWLMRSSTHTARASVPTRSSPIAKVSACRARGEPVDTESDDKGPGAPPSGGRVRPRWPLATVSSGPRLPGEGQVRWARLARREGSVTQERLGHSDFSTTQRYLAAPSRRGRHCTSWIRAVVTVASASSMLLRVCAASANGASLLTTLPGQNPRRRIRRRSRLRIPHTEMGESGRPNGSMNSVTGPACVGTVPSSTSIE